MGCSPSSLASSTAAAAAAVGATTDGNANSQCTGASEKDDRIFFCIKLRRGRYRRSSNQQQCGGDASGESCSATNGDDLHGNMCNQALLNPSQVKNEADYEKMSSGKKDSIVTVAALGNFTHSVVRRATGSTGTSGTSSSGGGSRPGHRKSSLALTPEDETMDAHQVRK